MNISNKSTQGLTAKTASAPISDRAALFAALPVSLCLIDRDDRISYVNPAFETELSLVAGTCLGKPIAGFVDGEDSNVFTLALLGIRAGTGLPRSYEIRLKPDGQASRWAQVSLSLSGDDPTSSVILQFQPIDVLKQALETLQKKELRWRSALESAQLGVWDHDFSVPRPFFSERWKALRGLPGDADIDGSISVWINRVHPADRDHVLECIRIQDEGRNPFNTFQYRERHADGHWVWIESRGASIAWGEDGKPSRIIGTDIDITERKNAEAQIEEISRRLLLALDVSKIGVFEANLDTGSVIRDKKLTSIYGLDTPELAQDGAFFEKILHPDDRAKAMETVDRGIASQEPFANAFRIIRPDRQIRHIRSSSVTFIDTHGERKLIGANWDVTDEIVLRDELDLARQLAEARNVELEAARIHIEYNALHDHLTELPNRRFLDEQIADWIAGARSYCAVLHIDLDRFKQINDTLGHQAGDVMLHHTAKVLTDIVEKNDFVARVGGDEFLVLCDAAHTEDAVIAMTDRIIEALRQPVLYDGHPCRFGASVGIAWTTGGAIDAKQSLMNADIALYRAKGLGRNRYEFFTKQLQTQIHHAKRTADEIVRGLEDGEFVPFYQPQFDARTLDIAGIETLARWNHPERGLLAPDYFLKVAEDIHALSAIDRAIAEQALEHFEEWQRAGIAIPRLSVNVSSPRLRDPDLIDGMKRLRVPSGQLSFELLESIFLDDIDDATSQTLAEIKALGIDIEIDDFGTGHASIVGLMKLNPSRLKIDRALVKPIIETAEQRKLVGSIIDIGHSLNIEVVAEGVETHEHADILRDLGCDTLQGYAFARPMSKSHLNDFVKANGWRRAAKQPLRRGRRV